MIIKGMKHFQNVVKKKLAGWYNTHENEKIDESNVFIVWSCKTLQNYKCIVGTRAAAVLAEYTYNGDDGVLYEDIYKKIVNASHSVE